MKIKRKKKKIKWNKGKKIRKSKKMKSIGKGEEKGVL